jgi:hypothetical protein
LTFCSVSPAVCARELVRHSTKCSFSMKVLTTWASAEQKQHSGCQPKVQARQRQQRVSRRTTSMLAGHACRTTNQQQ